MPDFSLEELPGCLFPDLISNIGEAPWRPTEESTWLASRSKPSALLAPNSD